MWAGMVLGITCQRCNRSSSEWAYALCERISLAKPLLLNQAVAGFHCRGCKRSVTVYITARGEGEM
jgi:hypothetical protein